MRNFVVLALLLCAFVAAIDLEPYDETDLAHVSGQNANDAYYSSYANLGTGVPKQVYFKSILPGAWEDAENWLGNFAPRTLDNVFIDIDEQTIVTLSASRIARSLTVTLGNDLEIEDGATLVLANGFFPCEEGNFVDPNSITCGSCTGLGFQNLADQSHCNNCGDFLKIPNPDRTGCDFCPAGTVFDVNCTAITCDPAAVCLPCPVYQTSDGFGGPCVCCPAGSSSNGGEPCFVCPPGTDSHECGECVPCLPSLRDRDCPDFPNGALCNNQGTCSDITDNFGLERSVCSCNSGFIGPSCQVDTSDDLYTVSTISASSDTTITLPFPFESYNLQTRALPVGPNFEFPAGTVVFDVNAAIRPLGLETDYTAEGYVDPVATPPADCPSCVPQIFGWDLQAWDVSTNGAIQQNITGPYWINVPYDKLNEVVNPNAIHVFYWNEAETKWIDVQYHCTAYTGPIQFIIDDEGVLSIAAFELSAQYQVFLVEDENNWGPDVEVGNNQPGSPSFYGDHRPQTATTGITGLQPVAAPNDPGQADLSPGQKLQSSSAPAMCASASLLALAVAALL